jgi:LacI family sucrose operon transcriptional repressor
MNQKVKQLLNMHVIFVYTVKEAATKYGDERMTTIADIARLAGVAKMRRNEKLKGLLKKQTIAQMLLLKA